jgi:hypothetical protein
MGVPTVSTTMGLLAGKNMPCNLTFAGRHGQDCQLLQFAQAFEKASVGRQKPPVIPDLPTDAIEVRESVERRVYAPPKLHIMEPHLEDHTLRLSGTAGLSGDAADVEISVFVDGKLTAAEKDDFAWSAVTDVEPFVPATPLYGGYGVCVGKVNVVVIARGKGGVTAQHLSISPEA